MSDQCISRRAFGASMLGAAACGLAAPHLFAMQGGGEFRISLAQWSLHRALFAGELKPLDFPCVARERYGVGAVELVNSFFADKARDRVWLRNLKKRSGDAGVEILLIMCDGVGDLGNPDKERRGDAIDGHVRWLESAAALGCHSIRVNAASRGSYEEQQALAADGLYRLATLAKGFGLNVIVENHGGLSSNGAWLAGVLERVGLENCGTLPDFGNFCMDWDSADDPESWYDRYLGVEQMMPYAKAVSAKSHDFDAEGNESSTNFLKMMRIVEDAGYRGWIGIEYEGSRLSEHEGIIATKRLLERVLDQL